MTADLQDAAKRVVSIHVPARGTTVLVSSVLHCIHGFNPRSREGNDHNGSGNLV